MTLSLPGDIEPHLEPEHDFTRLRGPAVYALTLTRPNDVRATWHETFENEAPYLDELIEATAVVYIGAAHDLLRRLNDHVNGDKRKVALLRICDIEELSAVWWFDDADIAFERESLIATELSNEFPEFFIHQR